MCSDAQYCVRSWDIEVLEVHSVCRYVLSGASLTFIPAGQYVASGIAVLWTVNSCFAIVQVGFGDWRSCAEQLHAGM